MTMLIIMKTAMFVQSHKEENKLDSTIIAKSVAHTLIDDKMSIQ